MIGIVGAGEIVLVAHLPAYRKLGLRVSAIYDVNSQLCAAVAREAGAEAPPTLTALLENPEVEIVDVAVPPEHSAEIVGAALRAGKHVLAQKPLAGSIAEAEALVRLAAQTKRILVVNQQMRHSPVVKAIHSAAHDGRLGQIVHLSFDIDLPLPAGEWDHWFARNTRPVISLNTIHLLDTARYLLGEPVSIMSALFYDRTHLRLAGETEAMIAVDFERGAHLSVVDRRNAFDELHTAFRVVGERGVIRGTFGMWTNYPVGDADTAEYRPADIKMSQTRTDGYSNLGSGGQSIGWAPLSLFGRWVPDAFTGPISELMCAIRTGLRPGTDGADNLRTLALVNACYESARAGKRVELRCP